MIHLLLLRVIAQSAFWCISRKRACVCIFSLMKKVLDTGSTDNNAIAKLDMAKGEITTHGTEVTPRTLMALSSRLVTRLIIPMPALH
ncbi:hypothetical protein ACNKHT_07505 [Shigella flexneri]